MAKAGRSRRDDDQSNGGRANGQGDVPEDGLGAVPMPGTTGRFLVLMREDAVTSAVRALREDVGLNIASTADFDDGVADAAGLAGSDALVFDELSVAVVDAPPAQLQGLSMAAADSGIIAIEPERVVYALQTAETAFPHQGLLDPVAPALGTVPGPPQSRANGGLSVEYLLGYRDAVNQLADKLLADAGMTGATTEAAPAQVDESEATWGLQLTKATSSQYTGRGIRIAVLDTGMDLGHPDFTGRTIVSQSFVTGQAVQDGHGHGTHCIGTAAGPRQPGQLPRYGVAYEAEIHAGKVLSNQGSGGDSGILAGISWAIRNGCPIISMSLGAPTVVGQSYSTVFETVARRALSRGTLIIAAAGNESSRPAHIAPVGHPANCPSIMAVGAIDQRLEVASFSSGGLNPNGGQVDIAGPGVMVRSSWPRPTLYRTISGTSMATPHVAGLAALLAEADPDARGRTLSCLLMQTARRLALSARDVGAGLVQAP